MTWEGAEQPLRVGSCEDQPLCQQRVLGRVGRSDHLRQEHSLLTFVVLLWSAHVRPKRILLLEAILALRTNGVLQCTYTTSSQLEGRLTASFPPPLFQVFKQSAGWHPLKWASHRIFCKEMLTSGMVSVSKCSLLIIQTSTLSSVSSQIGIVRLTDSRRIRTAV